MVGNQKKGQLPRMLLTWGEGGIYSPNEASASISTPTKSQQRPSWHSLAKELVKWFVTQRSRSVIRFTQPFRDLAVLGVRPSSRASLKPRSGETPLITTNHCSLPSALAQEPPLHFHPKPRLPPTMPLFLSQSLTSLPSESGSNLLTHPHHQPQARQSVLRKH